MKVRIFFGHCTDKWDVFFCCLAYLQWLSDKNNVTDFCTLHKNRTLSLSCFYAKFCANCYARNNEHCFLVCHWRLAHSCIQEDPDTEGTRRVADGQKERWSDAFLMTQDPGNDHVMKRRLKKNKARHAPRKVDFCQGRRRHKTLEDLDLLNCYLPRNRLFSKACSVSLKHDMKKVVF